MKILIKQKTIGKLGCRVKIFDKIKLFPAPRRPWRGAIVNGAKNFELAV
jgi:hypothetical protein